MYPIIPILVAAGVMVPPLGSPVKHLGELKAGPVVTAEVPLYFPGPGTLRFHGVEAGCGCVRGTIPVPMLRAGESTTLRVEVNTLAQPTGPNTWRLRINTVHDGRSQPPTGEGRFGCFSRMGCETDVRLTADVVREVDVFPPAVALSTTGTATQVVTITDRRPKPLTVTAATADSADVTVELAPPSGGVQRLTVKVPADAPPGTRTSSVVITTTDPAYPVLVLPVTVSKRTAEQVVATPAAVELRDGVPSGVVLIRSPAGRPVKVASVTCDSPAVKLKWTDGAGPTAAVRVTPTGDRGSAVVRVGLSEPPGETLVVPVSWGGR